MPAPVFQAVGAQQNSATASVNVSWPTHQTNDIGLLVIETSGGGTTLTPPSGWAAVTGTPVTDVADATGSKLHVWWKRATSNAEAAVATGFSTSDHVVARLYTFRGCVTSGDPWNVTTTGNKTTASSTATVPAVTTTVADTLIVMIVGRPDDSLSTTHFGVPTNANLTGLAEAGEAGTNNGNGGGFVVSYGVEATPSNTGTSSISKGASTTDTYVVVALKQPTAYSMTADKATFTLTGRDAGTLYGRKLIADVRSYADTFIDAGLLYGRRFTGDVRSYALTGRDAGLNKGLSMPADRATFTLTGRDANFPRTYRLTADKATFTLTGSAAQFPLFARPVKFFLPERNLLTRSEEFDSAAWTKTNASITANAATAPDGTFTADQFVENALSSVYHGTNNGISKTASRTTYTSSAYVKPNGRNIEIVISEAGGASGVSARFDRTTLTITASGSYGSGYTFVSAAATSVGNGWYRLSLTGISSTATTLRHVLQPHNGTGSTYTGDGVSGFYVWGAQLEEGSTLTDYDPTGPAAAGRTDLRVARRLTADTRSYALTGNDATLTRTTVGAYTLTADKATFTLTGRDAGTVANRRLTADPAAFTLTGRDAGLRAARRIAADTSAFTLTGRAAGTVAGRRLTADTRTYALTGRDANFLRGIRFPAVTGAFTLTGYNAALTKTGSYSLLASPQSYALTGRDANLAAGRKLTADARAFTVTGNAANLLASKRLTASLGTYTLAAYPVDLKRGYLRRRIIIF
jgi:hypothetical protein